MTCSPEQLRFIGKLSMLLVISLLAVLRPIRAGIDRWLGAYVEPREMFGRCGDPWYSGYRAGRRAGSQRALEDDGYLGRSAGWTPYHPGSPTACSWNQGFRIGFCDGLAERA